MGSAKFSFGWLRNRSHLLLALVFFFYFLLINFNTPMIGEDYGLAPLNVNQVNLPLSARLPLIAHRIANQWLHWNARLGEQIAIMFLGFDKKIFNVANSLVSTVFVFLIFIYGTGRQVQPGRKEDLFSLSFIFGAYVSFMPHLGEITFWLAGAANYLWGVAILLIFFLPYRYLLARPMSGRRQHISPAAFGVFGLFAGMTNENTVPCFILLLILIMVESRRAKRKLPGWFGAGTLGLIMGYACLMLSPSTTRRFEYYSQVFNAHQLTLHDLLLRGEKILYSFIRSSAPFLLIFLLAVLIFLLSGGWSKVVRGERNGSTRLAECHRSIQATTVILLYSFISILVLVGNAYFEERAFLLVDSLLIGAAASMLFGPGLSRLPKYVVRAFMLVVMALTIWNMLDIYHQYSDFQRASEVREQSIRQQIAAGKTKIEVAPYKQKDTRVLTTREIWLRQSHQYHYYYGVEEISIEP